MIVSDGSLRTLIDQQDIEIDPFDPDACQPASYDCRLGDRFLTISSHQQVLRLDQPIHYDHAQGPFELAPHSFILATTVETIRLSGRVTAFVEGRSSIGRMGLFIQNAGWVDAGFHGQITLELYNANHLPIQLMPGRRICQLVFCHLDQPATTPYRGKYQHQAGPLGSHIHHDHDA